MALPKKQLREKIQNVDLNDEASVDSLVKWILDGASASRDAIQDKLDEAEARITTLENEATEKAAEYTKLASERDTLKTDLDALKATNSDAKKVQEQFDAYKAEIEAKETNTAKRTAIRKALKNAGVGRESFLDLLVDKVDLNGVELDGESVKDTSFVDGLKTSYADCFTSTSVDGVKPTAPVTSGAKTVTTVKEIMGITDRDARRKAIAENPELFTK